MITIKMKHYKNRIRKCFSIFPVSNGMGNKIKNKIAVFGYVLLEKLPSGGGLKTEVSGLSDYLSWLYKFALAAAAFLAVLMIVIGGIQMIVGGASETARSDGKKRIEQAIWGLLLAITAWLILYSINPDLVKTGLTIPSITIEKPAVTTITAGAFRCDVYGGALTGGHQTFFYNSLDECMQGCSSKNCTEVDKAPTGNIISPYGPPPSGTYSDADARSKLEPGITTNKGNCASALQTNCTSLYGLPISTVQALNDLAKIAGPFVITGGTEYGHKTHGPDKSVVDIRYDSSLISSLDSKQKSGELSYICEKGVIRTDCKTGAPDHFHVVFQK